MSPRLFRVLPEVNTYSLMHQVPAKVNRPVNFSVTTKAVVWELLDVSTFVLCSA